MKKLKVKKYIKVATYIGVAVLPLVSQESFAAIDGGLDELNSVVTETKKAVKTLCYLGGCASVVVGGYMFIQKQCVKSAGVASAVAVGAFKFPSLMLGAAGMLI